MQHVLTRPSSAQSTFDSSPEVDGSNNPSSENSVFGDELLTSAISLEPMGFATGVEGCQPSAMDLKHSAATVEKMFYVTYVEGCLPPEQQPQPQPPPTNNPKPDDRDSSWLAACAEPMVDPTVNPTAC